MESEGTSSTGIENSPATGGHSNGNAPSRITLRREVFPLFPIPSTLLPHRLLSPINTTRISLFMLTHTIQRENCARRDSPKPPDFQQTRNEKGEATTCLLCPSAPSFRSCSSACRPFHPCRPCSIWEAAPRAAPAGSWGSSPSGPPRGSRRRPRTPSSAN